MSKQPNSTRVVCAGKPEVEEAFPRPACKMKRHRQRPHFNFSADQKSTVSEMVMCITPTGFERESLLLLYTSDKTSHLLIHTIRHFQVTVSPLTALPIYLHKYKRLGRHEGWRNTGRAVSSCLATEVPHRHRVTRTSCVSPPHRGYCTLSLRYLASAYATKETRQRPYSCYLFPLDSV